MKEKNIFMTGGQVSGESMIGYKSVYAKLKRRLKDRLDGTGGIYVYGLYQTGKSSLLRKIEQEMTEADKNLICVYLDLNMYNTERENSFEEFLAAIISAVKEKLDYFPDADLEGVRDKIACFESDSMSSLGFRSDFDSVFRKLKKAGLRTLLLVDKFDAASNIFKSKADFELFRELTGNLDFSVCLITGSRQELCQIEHVNPNNSTFAGVMDPFHIKGFDDEDLEEYREALKDYDITLTDDDMATICYYCGSSPYLWSVFGYELVENKLDNKEITIDKLCFSPYVLTKINDYHDKVFQSLSDDKDLRQISFADKLAGIIIGPDFFVTDNDFNQLKGLGYLLEDEKYYCVSHAFTEYLLNASYNNDILNNFAALEKKLKNILEIEKNNLFSKLPIRHLDEKDNWYGLLTEAWASLESTPFSNSKYENDIKASKKRFNKDHTVLNVMSLEDTTRIFRKYWNVLEKYFNYDALSLWEAKLQACGKARNPLYHGNKDHVYSAEEQVQINSYCMEIIKKLS